MPVKIQINCNYQIDVPIEIRQELRLGSGDHLLMDVRDGVIVLVPERSDAVEQLRGLYPEIWQDADADDYINRERDAWATS